MRQETVSVDVTVNGKTFSRPFTKSVYETADDVLNALQDPKSMSTVIDFLNYATDLKGRAPIRQAILNTDAANEMAMEKSVKEFIKLRASVGKPVTEDQARKMVETMAAATA